MLLLEKIKGRRLNTDEISRLFLNSQVAVWQLKQ
jgi:hypothetical protein